MDWVNGLLVIAGLVLIVVSTVAIVVNLIVDIIKVLRTLTREVRLTGFDDLLGKLPERYLAPAVVLLFGVFLAAPDVFGDFVAKVRPMTAPPAE